MANLEPFFWELLGRLFFFLLRWKLHIGEIITSFMEWTMGFVAIALLVIGLVGQAFEMRKIRLTVYHKDGESASANIFMNKKNFKWYALLGAGIAIWYAAERV